ncbi:DUF4412 domain-containing protein [Roseomonas sp. F4]
MRVTLLAVLLATATLPALAQDRPPLFPTRDVAVTYRVTGARAQAGLPSMSIAWLAAQQTMRMDMGGMGYMVADHKAQRGFMVMEQMRMLMDIPMEQANTGLPSGGTFRRTGSDTVAGHPCTVWSFQDGQNNGTACVTADGVMLRAQGTSGGESGGMEATQVAYGTQDPARFRRPQGYQTMQMPQGMPQGMPGAPRR